MGSLVFSRRCIQERLYSLRGVISDQALGTLVRRLNKPGRDRLSAMWEVVWLAALGAERQVGHEEALPNGMRPDFTFDLAIDDQETVRVIGDVTSASDQGLNDRNPVRQFWEEIRRLALKHRLDPSHFRYDIGHQLTGEYPDRRIEISLPPLRGLRRYLKENVEPFLRSLRKMGDSTGRLLCDDQGVSFALSYNKSQQFGGGGHAAYNLAYSPTKTPLFTALEKKAIQLSDAPGDSIRLVILCDAGCHAMQPHSNSSVWTLSATEIVSDYLRQSSSIDAALLVTVVLQHPMDAWRRYFRVEATFVAPTEGTRLTAARVASLRTVLSQALDQLPQPKNDAANAAIRMGHDSNSPGLHGATKMTSTNDGLTVRVSARAVLELLTGTINFDQFQDMHRWDQHDVGPFVSSINAGALIQAASLIPGGNDDDDWLEFKFGDPDPAVAPFRSGLTGSD